MIQEPITAISVGLVMLSLMPLPSYHGTNFFNLITEIKTAIDVAKSILSVCGAFIYLGTKLQSMNLATESEEQSYVIYICIAYILFTPSCLEKAQVTTDQYLQSMATK